MRPRAAHRERLGNATPSIFHQAVAEKFYTNITRWTEMKKGGHFAALEQPDALALDVSAFFSGLGS